MSQADCKEGFPGGSVVKNPPANVGDAGDEHWIHGLGRSPGVGNGNLVLHSCLENPMDRGAWWATAHGVTKSWTQLTPMHVPGVCGSENLARDTCSCLLESRGSVLLLS